MPDNKKDEFGDFLVKYDEYLDGRRSYSDLPVLRACDSHGVYRADAATPPDPFIPTTKPSATKPNEADSE